MLPNVVSTAFQNQPLLIWREPRDAARPTLSALRSHIVPLRGTKHFVKNYAGEGSTPDGRRVRDATATAKKSSSHAKKRAKTVDAAPFRILVTVLMKWSAHGYGGPSALVEQVPLKVEDAGATALVAAGGGAMHGGGVAMQTGAAGKHSARHSSRGGAAADGSNAGVDGAGDRGNASGGGGAARGVAGLLDKLGAPVSPTPKIRDLGKYPLRQSARGGVSADAGRDDSSREALASPDALPASSPPAHPENSAADPAGTAAAGASAGESARGAMAEAGVVSHDAPMDTDPPVDPAPLVDTAPSAQLTGLHVPLVASGDVGGDRGTGVGGHSEPMDVAVVAPAVDSSVQLGLGVDDAAVMNDSAVTMEAEPGTSGDGAAPLPLRRTCVCCVCVCVCVTGDTRFNRSNCGPKNETV